MGVYILNREMPTNCQECPCLNSEHFYCQVVGLKLKDENHIKRRSDFCPLVEVKPHGRLIDADALPRYSPDVGYLSIEQKLFNEAIDEAPTIIEAEK